jgi:hypothetical protein
LQPQILPNSRRCNLTPFSLCGLAFSSITLRTNPSSCLLVAATKRLQHPRRITPSNQHRLAVPRDQRRKIIWIVHDLSTQYAARTSASVEKRSGACNAGKRHNKGLA